MKFRLLGTVVAVAAFLVTFLLSRHHAAPSGDTVNVAAAQPAPSPPAVPTETPPEVNQPAAAPIAPETVAAAPDPATTPPPPDKVVTATDVDEAANAPKDVPGNTDGAPPEAPSRLDPEQQNRHSARFH